MSALGHKRKRQAGVSGPLDLALPSAEAIGLVISGGAHAGQHRLNPVAPQLTTVVADPLPLDSMILELLEPLSGGKGILRYLLEFLDRGI